MGTDCGRVTHRERSESLDLVVLVVSVDLLDPWDPLDWLDPLASLDVRYQETIVPVHLGYPSVFSTLVCV